MKYMDVSQAAEKWGISDRRIRLLCAEGRIDGAIKMGWSWTIPSDAPKPRDGRVLRRFKAMNIRPGSVDIDELERLMERTPLDDSLSDSRAFLGIIQRSIVAILKDDGVEVSEKEAKAIFSGRLVPHLPLETHLVLINARSLMIHFLSGKEKWCEKDAREAYGRLMQGIDDRAGGSYRHGFAVYPLRGGGRATVSEEVETAFMQYERSWSSYQGITAAVILYAAMLRIEPFAEYPKLFAYLVMSYELIRRGILPPLVDGSAKDEMTAAFSLAVRMGNYEDFTHLIEREIHDSYKVMQDV